MKSVVIALVALASTEMVLQADIPRIRIPQAQQAQHNQSEEAVSPNDPPSESEVGQQIRSLGDIKDFNLSGWAVTFEVMAVIPEKKQRTIAYRGIAVKPGSPQYAYWVYKVERANSARFSTITVDPPVPINACPDGTDLNGMDCGEK